MIKILKKIFLKIVNKKKNNNFDFKNTNSVLFKVGDRIGDAVIITSALNQLRQAFPNIKLGYFVSKHNKFIFENSPLNVVCVNGFWDCLKNRKKWQVIINIEPAFTSKNLLHWFLLAPQYIISFPKSYKKYYNKDTVITDLYIEKVCHFSKILSLTPFKEFVKDIPVSYVMPPLPKEKQTEVSSLWKKEIKILVCPKGSYRKIAPEVLFESIAALSKNRLQKCHFIFPYTKGIEEYFVLKNIKNCFITFVPKLDTLSFFALIKSSDIILSVDSASVHLAVAYKKHLIALFLNYKGNMKCFAPETNDKTTLITTKKEYFKAEEIFKDFDIPSITKSLEKYIDIFAKNLSGNQI